MPPARRGRPGGPRATSGGRRPPPVPTMPWASRRRAFVVEALDVDERGDAVGDRLLDPTRVGGELLVAAGAAAEEHLEGGLVLGDEPEVGGEAALDLLARPGGLRRRLADRVAQAAADVLEQLEVELALRTEVLVQDRLGDARRPRRGRSSTSGGSRARRRPRGRRRAAACGAGPRGGGWAGRAGAVDPSRFVRFVPAVAARIVTKAWRTRVAGGEPRAPCDRPPVTPAPADPAPARAAAPAPGDRGPAVRRSLVQARRRRYRGARLARDGRPVRQYSMTERATSPASIARKASLTSSSSMRRLISSSSLSLPSRYQPSELRHVLAARSTSRTSSP